MHFTVGLFRASRANRVGLALLLTLASPTAFPQAPEPFNPGPNQPVLALAIHPDGSWIGGGSFSSIASLGRNGLARFEPSNLLDNSFNPGSSSTIATGINAIHLDPDALLIVGSGFTNLSGLPRQRLARLSLTGGGDIQFNPGANSNVLALARQADGKIIVGGSFTNLAGQARAYLGRLNADGSLDATFDPLLNGPVQTLLIQNDGLILIGGEFTSVDGTPRNFIARLDSTGELDGGFDPSANGPVYCFAQQADERLLVGGAFDAMAAQPRLRLARIETTGALDATFTPQASGKIHALALQADGRIFVGGNFTNFNGLTRSNLVRLTATGSLDNYVSDPNAAVLSLGLQADGRLLVSGNFTGIGGGNRTRFARLANDITATQTLTLVGTTLTWLREGGCPEIYRAELSYSLNGLDWVALPSPSRIASGWQLSGVVLPAQATLRARGQVRGGYHNNSSWWTEFSSGPIAISVSPQDQPAILNVAPRFSVTAAGAGPFFYRWYRSNVLVYASQFPVYTAPVSSVAGVTQYEVVVSNAVSTLRSRPVTLWTPGADALNGNFSVSVNTALPQPDGSLIAGGASFVYRFNPNGLRDTTFTPAVNGSVLCLAAQGDQILMAGSFTTVAGFSRNCLARLDAFGSVDASFNPNVNGTINALVRLADGQILIGGSFTTVGGIQHTNLARLNADGTPDATFNPFANATVHSLAVQPDGLILVGGAFTQMNGVARSRLARLQSNGALDSGFHPACVGTAIFSIIVQPDTKILVAGDFTSLGGQARNRIGRLRDNGLVANSTLDTAFNPNVNGSIMTMQLQTDGRIWIGGSFTSVGGQTRNCLARLNPDGSLDPTIGPNANSGSILGLALQGDGKLLACGSFTSLYSASRSRLGRVLNNTPATQSLTTDSSSVTWLRAGSSPEIEHARFEFCTNGTDWIELPAPTRMAGGWQTTGLSIPLNATLRARGFANGGLNNGTTCCTEVSSGPPVIAIGPTDLRGTYPNSERLTVTTYGDGPFTFRWYRNGVLLPTETNPWLNAIGTPNVFVYEVEVTSLAGTIRSQPLTYWAQGPDGFNPNADGMVRAIAVQPDQKILLGGDFANSPGNRLARLHPNGSRDLGFTPTMPVGAVYALAVQTNGQILVGGSFTNLNGQTRSGLGRLNPDGSLDTSFHPVLSSPYGAEVQCLAIQPDGKILVGGWFQFLAGQSRYCLGRLNSDGSLDNGFVPPGGYFSGPEAGITSIILEPNGDVLVFGEMREVPPMPTVITYAQRLDASGNRLHRIFFYSPVGPPPSLRYVTCAVRQPDGGIIIGGSFAWVENSPFHRNIARIDANGFLDQTFTNSANNFVTALAVQADGRTVVGGNFTSIGGQSRNGLARLNEDGTVDPTFTSQASGSAWVHSLAVQPDGRLLVGGSFTNLAGSRRNNIGRLLGPELATESLHWDGNNATWQRSGVSPEVAPTILETSTDGVNWNYQGDGVRTTEGWQWFGVAVPPDGVIRTRGFVGGGNSFWHVESILPTSPRAEPILLTTPGSLSLGTSGFGFNVDGNLGHLAIIEASTNLTQWTAIQTNRLLPPPTFFNDSSATNLPRRFYRARLP